MADRSTSGVSAADGSGLASGTAAVELTALVVAHHAAVYRYACRLCGCPTEAEDLTQQTFLIAHEKLHQLREAERACSWLLAVLRSCFLKSIRKPRPLPVQNVDFVVEEVAARAPDVEEVDREQLAAALAELPDEFLLVLLMFYFEELSYQQIAEELEIPIGTVMSRLSRAKGHLRRRLAPAEDDTPKVAPPPRSAAKSPGGWGQAKRDPGVPVLNCDPSQPTDASDGAAKPGGISAAP
jgi:RNA polymerase sigma factor (sigma-70 family)